jgi:hypothetical protein
VFKANMTVTTAVLRQLLHQQCFPLEMQKNNPVPLVQEVPCCFLDDGQTLTWILW